MDLSNDLISKFVKITNDGNKKKTKEGTVYGTTVEYDGAMYVKIDGSDLLTPIDTTADIKEGERVTIMIKDHNATVTGNITSPSASSADVKKVTRNVEEIEGEITEFEAIIADVVHVGELDAEVARIDELIAGKATIEDLTATNAEITNLKAKDAEIENLVADKATIEDLTATNAEITNLKAKDAEIENLVADKASIEDLTATNAEITKLKAQDAEIEKLVAAKASIGELDAVKADINDLQADKADITVLNAAIADIETLTSDLAIIDQAVVSKANITDLNAANAQIADLQANKADITDLNAANAQIAELQANKADITDLNATNANINTLDAEVADIQTLVNGNLTSDNIASLNLTSANTTIQNAMIKDAMIDSITASKIKSGIIDTNLVTIQSTDGSMILTGSVQQFKDENGVTRIQIGKDTGGNFTFILYDESGTGVLIDEDGIKSSNAIADGLIVDAKVADNANIAGSKLDIASVITEVNNDNSTTIKSNKIYLDEQGQSLEVAFNSLKTQVETIQDVSIDGDLTTVMEQVQSNTTQIAANKEGISTLVSENTIRKEEIQNLDGEIESVNNTLSSKYSSLEQDVSGFKTTVAETYTTKSEFNNLQIGGTNLFPNSGNFKDNYGLWVSNGSTITLETVIKYNGYNTIKIDNNTSEGIIYNDYITLRPNTTYTYSITAVAAGIVTGDNNTPLHMWVHPQGDNSIVHCEEILDYSHTSIGTSWGRSYIVFKTPDTDDVYVMKPFIFQTQGQIIYIANFKVEEGNRPTAWSPAPEDVQRQIDATNNNLTNNYSTTSAMNSAIVQKANEITSSVSETYTTKSEFNNLQIGGKNLLLNSKRETINNNYLIDSFRPTELFEVGEKYTVSICVTPANGVDYIIPFVSGGYKSIGNALIVNGTTKQVISSTFIFDGYASDKVPVDISDSNAAVEFYRVPDDGTVTSNTTLHWVKIEKGAKATDWSPAPEDVQGRIDATNNNLTTNYSTTSAMNSAINQKANEITSSVSETYATKQSVTDINNNLSTNYSTTSAMNSAIQQKANEITSSVSETYTTKTEFNNLQIGGTNTFRISKVGSETWDINYNSSVTANGENGFNVITTNGKMHIRLFYTIKDNGYWTVRFKVKTSVPVSPIAIDICDKTTDNFSSDTNWTEITRTVLVDNYSVETYHFVDIEQHVDCGQAIEYYFKDVKVEKGNKATAWSPAPEDIQGQIDATNNNLANNYSTTSVMNSAIEQKANEITSSVSETYTTKSEFNNLQIGGTNLIQNGNFKGAVPSSTSMPDPWTFWGNEIHIYHANGAPGYNHVGCVYIGCNLTDGSQSGIYSNRVHVSKVEKGANYMASFIFSRETNVKSAVAHVEYLNDARDQILHSQVLTTARATENVVNGLNEHQYHIPFTMWTGDFSYVQITFNHGGTNVVSNGYLMIVGNVQIEKGNKATAWSPAPEDIQGQIDATNNNLATNYSTTSAMNSAINQKANEITSSVSQTYATKQSVTDINNNLSTNYSTTEAMNSAINQKANEITSSVSQTYTTKTEFNNLEVGGTNLVYNGGFNRNLDGWNSNGNSNGVQVCTESPSGYMACMVITTHGNGLYQYFTFHDSTYCIDYVVSFYAKTDVDGSQMYVSMEGDPATSSVFTLNGVWQKCVYKFRRNNTGSNALVFYANGAGARNIYIHSVKMEKGTVPSAWSPHPSEIENKVDNLSNNLTTNYSTTTQMNSAIDQKANEITSAVSQTYISNYEAKKLADTTTTGLNKYLFERYQRDGFDYGSRPTLNDLVGARLIESQLMNHPPAHTSDLGSNYIGVLTFYLYYDYACTKTVTVTTDDSGTVYLNNVGIYELTSYQPANVTFNMIKGLNRIDIVYAEGGGGDGVSWGGVDGYSAFGAYANVVTNEIAKRTNELTLAMTQGNMLYTDPTFRNGMNSVQVYNNKGNGTVTHERIAAIEGCPNTSGYCLKITTNGEANPNLGGFYFGTWCRYNAVFITKITAKIPVGCRIGWASNATGNNTEQKWLSTIEGTGNWHDYYCKVKCGDSGDLGDTNFFYLKGPQATAENPVTWYVSYATVFDVTDSDERITNLTNNLATNYSTTTQMNSAIDQKANEITSSVSQTYTTKSETTAVQNQITTSRNLLMGSRDYNLGKWTSERAAIQDEWYNGTRIYITSQDWANMDYFVSDLIDRGVIELHTPYTFSCYVMSTGSDYTPEIYFFGGGSAVMTQSSTFCGTATTSWQRLSITFEWVSFSEGNYPIRFEATTASPSGSYLKWACFQLERGRIATGWGPAPEDAQYAINDINNNLTNNFSTTVQMNSAIQQKANEITSSVSQAYVSKSEAATMNDTVAGNRKWLFEQYTNNQNVGIGNVTYPTLAHLANETLIASRLVDGLPGYTSELGNYYLGVYTVYLYYESAYTWNGSIISDDESTTYLNGVAVCQAPSCTSTTFTMNFKKGINKLQIIHGEGGGGDGVTLSDLGPWKEYGAYPACVAAASSNYYASNSDIVQTVNDLTIKFTESGGYNLLQNGHGDKSTSYWENNGGGISVLGGAAGGASGNYFSTSLPTGIKYYSWVHLLPNTHYVYQAKVWSNAAFTGTGGVPLHYWFSYDASTTTGEGYTILDYQQNVQNVGTWTQLYLHFVTGNRDIYFKPFIYHPDVSTSIYVTELMLSQSRVVQPWSPHPSEVYSGITQIDKDGIRVQHSNFSGYTHMAPTGFYINHNGADVVALDASGLRVTGSITATSGQIAHYTINEHALVGTNVGLCGNPNYGYWAIWSGSSDSGSAPFRVGHGGELYATNANITGTINATAGTFSGNIVTNNIVKAYNSVYAGAEVWGGYKLDSTGSYVSSQTFTIHGSAAVQIDGNPTRISSVTGEVKIGDSSSYNNLRAREIYAQEIIYTDDLRTRSASQLSLSNVSMRGSNAFIEFSSGYGVIRVPDVNHLYLQTGGGAANTSSEVRCTAYKDGSTYVNLRAYNLCAQNAVYANGVNVSSDRDRKRDIELYATDALHEVCTTPVYSYHLDTDKDEELKRIGIIMQEAPLDAIDLTGKGVDLYQMVTMLWKATQQQQEMIEELKQQLKGE